MLLAFDTATPAVTVAVADGPDLLASATQVDARRHGELLAPAIADVLSVAGRRREDITGIAVGVGPGPFTGLRVGLVTAVTLAAVLDVAVIGVCTLDVIAFEASERGLAGRFRVATDARRREVYWASYHFSASRDGHGRESPGRDGRARYAGPLRRAGPHVARPADVPGDGPVAGQGPLLYPEAFPVARSPQLPSAAALCRLLAAGGPTVPPRPLYLRRPDAAEPRPRRSVRP